MTAPHSISRRRGSTLIWTTVVLTLLTAFCSLAVDVEGKPSNLKILQIGTGRTSTAQNDFSITAAVTAPGSTFIANNKLFFYGTAVFQSVEAKNNTEIFVDEQAVDETTGGLVQ